MKSNPHVTTNKVAIEYTQNEMRQEWKLHCKLSTKQQQKKMLYKWRRKVTGHTENNDKSKFFLLVFTLNVNKLNSPIKDSNLEKIFKKHTQCNIIMTHYGIAHIKSI